MTTFAASAAGLVRKYPIPKFAKLRDWPHGNLPSQTTTAAAASNGTPAR